MGCCNTKTYLHCKNRTQLNHHSPIIRDNLEIDGWSWGEATCIAVYVLLPIPQTTFAQAQEVHHILDKVKNEKMLLKNVVMKQQFSIYLCMCPFLEGIFCFMADDILTQILANTNCHSSIQAKCVFYSCSKLKIYKQHFTQVVTSGRGTMDATPPPPLLALIWHSFFATFFGIHGAPD